MNNNLSEEIEIKKTEIDCLKEKIRDCEKEVEAFQLAALIAKAKEQPLELWLSLDTKDYKYCLRAYGVVPYWDSCSFSINEKVVMRKESQSYHTRIEPQNNCSAKDFFDEINKLGFTVKYNSGANLLLREHLNAAEEAHNKTGKKLQEITEASEAFWKYSENK